ncbi:Fic family protein [Lichenibacterium ramalinae]|uniref:Fic family protein n=2 Tax=Lichenibacterium ramalinae TaxID=2316527 RepID=A0A4Q2RJT1_9HYPH|nr:Fic family protein [Lichenibacterium ramalinae]
MKARREAENGIRQFRSALDIIQAHIAKPDRPLLLTPTLIKGLHKVALDGINIQAGSYRNEHVTIQGSQHIPPRPADIPDFVLGMCDHIDEYWHGIDATELAAYVLWRINWIHPFADGNGRTARTICYMVLSAKLGYVLPGSPTIPEQIAADKQPYYKVLEEADDSWKRGFLALSGMESMLEAMLERQLRGAAPAAAN